MKTSSSYNNETKIRSRLTNMEQYRRLSGNYSIPKDQAYVTLSSVQEPSEDSEICQVVGSGLAQPEQFIGIDSSQSIIEGNRRIFPRSRWIAGRWASVMRDLDVKVGMAYLDTCYVGDNPKLVDDVLSVMRLVRPGSVVFVNALTGSRGHWAMGRPGRPIDDGYLLRQLRIFMRLRSFGENLGRWDLEAASHTYANPNGNWMLTRAFVRKD